MEELPYEYLKLDEIDLEVIIWIHEKHPNALMTSLEYMKKQYKHRGIDIDILKVCEELNRHLEL